MLVTMLLAACRYGPVDPTRGTGFGTPGLPWAVTGSSWAADQAVQVGSYESAHCEVAAGRGAAADRGCSAGCGESGDGLLGPNVTGAYTAASAGEGAEHGIWRTRADGLGGVGGDTLAGAFFWRSPYPLDALVAALYAGDGGALPALLDAVEDMGAGVDQLLRVGVTYYIRTPTYHYFGTVQAVGTWGVVLAPGGYQASWLADLPTTLATGRLSPRDSVTPLPTETPIPFLWVGPSNPFPFPLDWQRTHPAVTSARPPRPPGWDDPGHANPDQDPGGDSGANADAEDMTTTLSAAAGIPDDAVMAGYAAGLG